MADPINAGNGGPYAGMVPGAPFTLAAPPAPPPSMVPARMTANLNMPLGVSMFAPPTAAANPVAAAMQARPVAPGGPVAGFVAGAPAAPPPAPAAAAAAPAAGASTVPPGAPTIASTVTPAPASATPGTTPLPQGTPTDGEATPGAAGVAPGGTGAGGGYGAMPAAGTHGVTNPFGQIQMGFNNQFATGQQWRDQALDYINQGGGNIFDRATRARAIIGIDNAVMGPNNQGASAAQGADSYNTAMATLGAASTQNESAHYTADQENVRAAAQVAAEMEKWHGTPLQTGGTSFTNAQGLTSTVNTFAMPPTKPGQGMIDVGPNKVREDAAWPVALKVGAPYKGADGTYPVMGKQVIVKNGTVSEIK